MMQQESTIMFRIVFVLMSVLSIITRTGAQTHMQVHVVQAMNDSVIPHASIYILNDGKTIHCDPNGRAQIDIPATQQQLQFRVLSEGFRIHVSSMTAPFPSRTTIRLQPLSMNLQSAEIAPDLWKHLYFGRPGFIVRDYTITNGGIIALLHDAPDQRQLLAYISHAGKLSDTLRIPVNYDSIYVSGLQKTYLVGDSSVLEIAIRKGIIEIVPVKRSFFNRKVVYYKGGWGKNYYIAYPTRSCQTIGFIREDAEKKIIYINSPFCVVTDQAKEQRAQTLYSQMQGVRILELSEIIPDYDPQYDILDGHDGDASFALRQEFMQRYVKHPVYAPLIQHGNHFSIADMIGGQWHEFDSNATLLSTRTFQFHNEAGSCGVLFWDSDSAEHVYTTKMIGNRTELLTIDVRTLTICKRQTLSYGKPEKCTVHNGFVYYLYAPDPKTNETFLFREQLEK